MYFSVFVHSWWLLTTSPRQALRTRISLPQGSPRNSNLPPSFCLGAVHKEILWLLFLIVRQAKITESLGLREKYFISD
jgi:hypothetical protein